MSAEAPEQSPTQAEQARQLVKLAKRAFKRHHPLFILVQYNHEADKLSFLNQVKDLMTPLGINTRNYDPLNNQNHGATKLYPLLKQDATEQVLSLVISMPRQPDSDELAADFLSYINLHRDNIAHDQLHWVLFLREGEMPVFMDAASDLWSFRHRTFWLEREIEKPAEILWQNVETLQASLALTEQENQQIKAHVESIKQLVDETADNQDKAEVLLDLTAWLSRRSAFQMAIEIALEGIRLVEGRVCALLAGLEGNLGAALFRCRVYPEALSHHKLALKISRQLNNQAQESDALNHIAQILVAQGDYNTALGYLNKSLMIAESIDYVRVKGMVHNSIALVHIEQGDYDVALDHLKRALSFSANFENKSTEAAIFASFSSVYHLQGDYDNALVYLKRSLTLMRDTGDIKGEGTVLNNISLVYLAKSDDEAALGYLQKSLSISQSVGDKIGVSLTLNNMSPIYYAKGDYDTALNYLNQSGAISRDIGDKAGYCTTLLNIGCIYWEMNKQERAQTVWLEAYRIAEPMKLYAVLEKLGSVAEQLGLAPGLEGWAQLSKTSK
ncbi:MAG: tetratricopeptide (TPR) repeat protein [Phenylobacterium sp.]|jgi:tetratricopeptide (TPR) repeat protein